MAKRKQKRMRSRKRKQGTRRVTTRRVKTRRAKKSNHCKSAFKTAIQQLRQMRGGKRSSAIQKANDKFIQEFCKQVRRLKFAKVSPSIKKRLQKERKNINRLISPKTNMKSKRVLLSKHKGGFLPLLLAALPAIGSIAGGIISRT